MSGGSFDYLYLKDASELMQSISLLEEMEETLLSFGYAEDAVNDAVNDTAQVIQLIEKYTKEIEYLAKKLAKVWRAVEYKVSGDYGHEEVRKALDEYRSTSK